MGVDVCVFRGELVDVVNELQTSSPTPHHALHVILQWEKAHRVSGDQLLHPQLMKMTTMQDDDDADDRNHNVTRTV